MSYSDVASALGRGGPRQVGQALARFGSGVPWWRVLRADGSCAPVHGDEQREPAPGRRGSPFVGDRVDMGAPAGVPDRSRCSRMVSDLGGVMLS